MFLGHVAAPRLLLPHEISFLFFFPMYTKESPANQEEEEEEEEETLCVCVCVTFVWAGQSFVQCPSANPKFSKTIKIAPTTYIIHTYILRGSPKNIS